MTLKNRRFSRFPTWLRLLNSRFFEFGKDARELRASVREEIRVRPGLLVEIGCGFGINARLREGDYLGLDPDPRVIEAARQRNPGRRFETLDGADLGLPDGSAAVALFVLTLHETPREDMERVLAEARRVAKNVLVFDYNTRLAGLSGLWIRLNERADFRDYLAFDIAGTMERAGWRLAADQKINRTFHKWVFSKGA